MCVSHCSLADGYYVWRGDSSAAPLNRSNGRHWCGTSKDDSVPDLYHVYQIKFCWGDMKLSPFDLEIQLCPSCYGKF